MTLGLCACGSSTSSDVANVEETKTSDTVVFEKPGTYTATAAGRNGDVTLTVEFSDTAIVYINVDSEETETIGVSAMDTLVEQVIGSQSVAVDTVSGATLSTEAFIECLNSCVEQAGGNMELLGGEITSEKVSYETEADVIVVGAGGAGLMAALTAANDGASVILLEKSSSIGGNTLCAANGINAYDSDVQLADETYQAADTSVEEFEALQTNERSRIDLVDAFINNSAEAINYLSDLGVDFTVEISEDERNTDSNYYLLKSEEDGTTTMTTIINALSTALDASGVVLYKNTEATSLVQDENGNVTGVNAIGENEEELTFTGKSVVLCTGGFGKNNELIAQVAPDYANCITDELAPTTGDGLIMATEIGAEAVDLDQIQTFPAVISGYGMILPMNLPGGFGLNGTIYVNNAGERFAAEAFEIPDAILAQENGEVYAVFTEENLNDTMKELMGIGYVVSADSAEELASQLGVDADGLKASIDTWNADAASNGTDSAFGRENITPLEGTLYGYKFGVGAHYFMGGILIDENTCVLNTDGSIIDGLYAAGEVTGGFHGTQRVDGSGTGDSIVFGMIAGHSAAAAAQN
jgi:flavocytochrome c